MSNQIILVPVKLDKTEVQNSSANVVYLPFASSTNPGVIKINDLQFTMVDGVLSLHYASGGQAGIIKINDGDFTIDGDGILSLKDVSILQNNVPEFKALSVIAQEHQTDIEKLLFDLDVHIDETEDAHNIPAQIDGKIATHNGAESNSHIDMRNNIATNISDIAKNKTDIAKNKTDIAKNKTDIATINDITILATNTRVTAVENSKITISERTKLSDIDTKAQVNKIENIIISGLSQSISKILDVEKSVDLTSAIQQMIDAEISILLYNDPDLLDTIAEIAEALNNDLDFYNTITGMINKKLDADFINNETITVSEFDESGIIAINVKVNGVTEVKKISIKTLLKDVYDELATKISNIDLINELPNDLIYGGENVELVEPVVTVYNAERLDGKLENALDVNSAVYDSDSNIIKDTYIKNTDVIAKATNADKILFDGSYVGICSTSVNYSTNSGTAATADKLNNKESSYYVNLLEMPYLTQVANNLTLVGRYDKLESAWGSKDNFTLNVSGKITGYTEVGNSPLDIVLPAKTKDTGAWNISTTPFKRTGYASLTLPYGLQTIGMYTFYNWSSNNQTLIIPDSVTSIGEHAFSGWLSNNKPLIIPNSVTSIGSGAFYDWEANNKPLTIPYSVTSIGDFTFYNWKANNKLLTILSSVTSIGEKSFYDWRVNAHPVTIPSSVTSIGKSAFNGWWAATEFIMESVTPPTLGANAFDSSNNAPIYVPNDSVTAYKTATNWDAYATRIFPISDRG